METGMIVEKRELFFLLSCRGLKSCPSVFAPDDNGRPEEILESLFRKGRITNAGERFQVDRELAGAVRQITEAKAFLCLCHGNRKRELLYLYPGDRILAVQEIFQRKHALRLLFLEREDLGLYLKEQDLLVAEQNWEPLPYVDKTAPIMPIQIQKRSDLADHPWLWLLAEEMDGQSDQIFRQMGIVRAGFQNEIVIEDMAEGVQTREPYEEGHFVEKLLEWI